MADLSTPRSGYTSGGGRGGAGSPSSTTAVVHYSPPRTPDRQYVDPYLNAASHATPEMAFSGSGGDGLQNGGETGSFGDDHLLHAETGLPGRGNLRFFCFLSCCGGMGTDMGRTAARRAAKTTLLLVAFLVAVAQWSCLASGVAFFSKVVGLSESNAATVTSAAFSVCFLSSIVGGILGDARLGSVKVLFRGLIIALFSSFAMATLQFPLLGVRHELYCQILMGALMFIFAGACGLCQTAVPALVGDQCREKPQTLSAFYLAFYGCLQSGGFFARVFFPFVHQDYGWFIAIACFMTAPLSASLLLFAMNNSVIAYKAPLPYSVAYRACRVVIRRYILRQSRDELEAMFGDDLVREALRTAAVLKLHIPLPVFWALYFQMFSLWYLQTKQMDLQITSTFKVAAEQVTALNPLFDVTLLGFFGAIFAIYKKCRHAVVSPKVKIALGYLFAIGAFVLAVILQLRIDNEKDGHKLSVLEQAPQFVLICAAEVLVYPAALHLVYIHSPISMRSFVQSVLWFFIGIGNLFNMTVVGASSHTLKSTTGVYIGYTAAMGLAWLLFLYLAKNYDLHVIDAPLVTSPPKQNFIPSGMGSSPERPTTINNSQENIAKVLQMTNSIDDKQPRVPSPSKAQYLSGATKQSENQPLLGGHSAPLEVERRRPISPRDHGSNSNVVYYSTRKKSAKLGGGSSVGPGVGGGGSNFHGSNTPSQLTTPRM